MPWPTYLKHDTAIVPVLLALVASPVFSASRGTKVRDPGEDVVATWRSLQVKARKPVARIGCRVDPVADLRPRAAALQLEPSRRRTVTNAAWASTGRMTGSWGMHYAMAGGWWPRNELKYKSPEAWLPRKSVRFDDLVDHLSQELLSRPATKHLMKACCQALDVKQSARIDKDHAVVKWQMPLLITTLLDSPDHMTR
jgi:hypothetical protein